MTREVKFVEALNEAVDQCMAKDPSVYVMGLGVPDPKGVFGSTLGLASKYGSQRVMDMPTAENGMTGIALGSALVGMRPVMVHQRLDFALLALDPLVNQAAKWHYMFGGQLNVPLVVRLIIGRGWGQGPQHSQSLQSWFAHIPGLKVVMPATPYDAKGMLISSIEDDNPVIFIEQRWLHNVFGPVPQELYRVPLGKARIVRSGNDLTIVAVSFMVVEALRAAAELSRVGIDAEVIDLRTLRPLDGNAILSSVEKTGRLIAIDSAWKECGMAGEIVALAAERAFDRLKCAPERVVAVDCPVPTTWALSPLCYPAASDVIAAAGRMFSLSETEIQRMMEAAPAPTDVPDRHFMGPF